MLRLILCIIGFSPVIAYTQTQFTLYPFSGSFISMEESWKASIQNLSGATQLVYLNTEYKNQNNEIITETQSQPFSVLPGENKISSSQLTMASTHYASSEVKQIIKRTGSLPEGVYRVCTQVITTDGGNILAISCFQQTCVNPQQNNKANTPEKRSRLSSSGNLSVEQYYTPPDQQNNLANNPYTRLQGQVGVTILDLPFKSQIRLSTERNSIQSQSKAVQFSFDAHQFKANLKKKLEDKMFGEREQELLSRAEDIAKLSELDNLEKLLADSALQVKLGIMNVLQQRIDTTNVGHLVDSATQIENFTQDALKKIAYYKHRENLEREIIDYQNTHHEDTTEFTNKMDSLNYELMKLDAQKEGIIRKQQTLNIAADSLHRQINRYAEWKKDLKKISNQQEEYQKLKTRRDQLRQFKQQLVSKNNLPNVSDEDVRHYDDPEYLKKRLHDEGMVSKLKSFLFHVDELDVGTIYPQFSPLMLSGIPVKGICVSLSPGSFYASSVVGKIQTVSYKLNPVHTETENGSDENDSLQISASTSAHRLIASRMGFGVPQSTHFYISAVNTKADHDNNSGEQNPNSVVSKSILGADMQFPLMTRYVTLQNYLAYALPSFGDTTNQSIARLASQTLLTFKTLSRNTNIKISARTIGAAYHSIGVPFLRTNAKRYAISADQAYCKHQFKTSALYSLDFYLTSGSQQTMVQQQLGGGVNISVEKWPAMQFNYRQTTQTTGDDIFSMTTWQFNGNQSYAIGNWMGSSMIYYTLLNSYNTALESQATNHQFQLNQAFMGPNLFSLSFNFHYQYKMNYDFRLNSIENGAFEAAYKYIGAVDQFRQVGIDGLVSFSLGHAFNTSIGAQLWHDPTYLYHVGERVQFNWQLSKMLQLQARAQRNQNNIQSTFLEASLKMMW